MTNLLIGKLLIMYISFLWIKIMDTIACISCNQNKSPNILEDNAFIMSFVIISLERKNVPIDHDKFTHLEYNCVTLKDLFDDFSKNITE